MNTKRSIVTVASLACSLFAASSALAGVHTWDVVEVFSNADGTIQYIELREMNGTNTEWHLGGVTVSADDGTGSFTFPANYPATTAGKSILLATQGAADLLALDPNNPVPDHIVAQAPFFDHTGDTVRFGPYDVFTFGAVPTDCINSMQDTNNTSADTPTVLASTPKNYTGIQGVIIDCGGTPVCYGDTTGDGEVNIDDYTAVILNWNTAGPDGDTDGDGDVDIDDYTNVILNWAACNDPPSLK